MNLIYQNKRLKGFLSLFALVWMLFALVLVVIDIPNSNAFAQMPCDWRLCNKSNPCPIGCSCTYPEGADVGYCTGPKDIHGRVSPKTLSVDQKKEARMVSVYGMLEKIAAIGGETTGWAIKLDVSLKVREGMVVKYIEVDPAGKELILFKDKYVNVSGPLEWRQGIERGKYPVIAVEGIQEAKTKK